MTLHRELHSIGRLRRRTEIRKLVDIQSPRKGGRRKRLWKFANKSSNGNPGDWITLVSCSTLRVDGPHRGRGGTKARHALRQSLLQGARNPPPSLPPTHPPTHSSRVLPSSASNLDDPCDREGFARQVWAKPSVRNVLWWVGYPFIKSRAVDEVSRTLAARRNSGSGHEKVADAGFVSLALRVGQLPVIHTLWVAFSVVSSVPGL